MPTPPTPSGSVVHQQTLVTQFAMLPNSVAPGSLLLPCRALGRHARHLRFHRHRPARRRHLLAGRHRTSRHPLARLAHGRYSASPPHRAHHPAPTRPPCKHRAVRHQQFNFVVTILDPSAYTLALSFAGLPTERHRRDSGFAGYPLNGPFPATLEGLPNGTNTTFALSYNPAPALSPASFSLSHHRPHGHRHLLIQRRAHRLGRRPRRRPNSP